MRWAGTRGRIIAPVEEQVAACRVDPPISRAQRMQVACVSAVVSNAVGLWKQVFTVPAAADTTKDRQEQ